jgi:uncharacterized protein
MQQPQRPLVIVHANCMDGTGAAYAASLFLNNPEYHAAAYGTEPPDVHDRDVYVLDFAYSREVLLDMASAARSLVVIDHHATAEAALGGLDFAHFDMTRSGCVLTWEYFAALYPSHLHPGMGIPIVLLYIQDRDLWQWALPNSPAISEYLRHPDIIDIKAPVAEQVVKMSTVSANWSSCYNGMVDDGEAMLRDKDRLVRDIAARAAYMTFSIDGVPYNVPVVYAPTHVTSEVGQRLAQSSPLGVGAVIGAYSHGHYGLSFRGVRGTTLARLLAEAYGGGGHDCAAGCGVLPTTLALLIATTAPIEL